MYMKPMNTKSYISNMDFTVLCIADLTPMKQAVICKDRDLDFLSVSSNAVYQCRADYRTMGTSTVETQSVSLNLSI